jgi:hypothetical protein
MIPPIVPHKLGFFTAEKVYSLAGDNQSTFSRIGLPLLLLSSDPYLRGLPFTYLVSVLKKPTR